MKVYSIGRENGCDIVINDNSDVISRRHATLNVTSSGKMTIVDLSQNGTYVNGIRISQNVPVPVTRKDTVSFAHVTKLNWDMIPKPNAYLKYMVIGMVAIVLVIGGVFGYNSFSGNSENKQATAAVADSSTVKKDTIPPHEKNVNNDTNSGNSKKNTKGASKNKTKNSKKEKATPKQGKKGENKKSEEKKTQYR